MMGEIPGKMNKLLFRFRNVIYLCAIIISMAYVYRHIRLDKNEVFYIGIANGSKRKVEQYHRAYRKDLRSNFWKRVATKTPYEVEIMLDELDIEEAKVKEIEFIKLYGRRDQGLGTLVNLTNGGDGVVGRIVSEDCKRRIGLGNKGKKHPPDKIYPKASIQAKQRMRLAKLGKKNVLKSKVILNVTTGVYYIGCQEAALAIGINYNTLYGQLRGVYKSTTDLRWV